MNALREVPRANVSSSHLSSTSRERHTFHGNLKSTRYGWLRLTPAYSVRLVEKLLDELLEASADAAPVLDPFCGTGTTLLSCAEHGVDCDTLDINPFLVWLARTKVGRYTPAHLDEARRTLDKMRRAVRRSDAAAWVPPIHQIEKWWSPGTLGALSRAYRTLARSCEGGATPAHDLLRVAFCQVLIARSRADFGHQSMSFQRAQSDVGSAARRRDVEAVQLGLDEAFERIALAAAEPLPATRRRVLEGDARRLHELLPREHYGLCITSPPYANRMSYIRELRPYMYWLRYLEARTAAGVLDWKAIGGTWGSATSNLGSWRPEPGAAPLPDRLEALLRAIAEQGPLLSTYVRKYFHDMAAHSASLFSVMRRGGRVRVVIGNSKFYDVVVPVEELLAESLERAGFVRLEIETLRKRSSKKELYEYLVLADRP